MSISVFLADDHAVVRDGLRCLLEAQSDIRVIGDAANGREAVRQVRQIRARRGADGHRHARAQRDRGHHSSATGLSRRTRADVVHARLARTRARSDQGRGTGLSAQTVCWRGSGQAVRAVHAHGAYLSQKIAGTVIADYTRDQAPDSPLDALTRRERQILQLIVEGKSNLEASRSLFLSQKTVETYRSRMMQKLSLTCLPDLMKFALRHGIATLE